MKDTLLHLGDAVKMIKNEDGTPSGRVGGYLVRFTDADHKDIDGEYFTADTYYGPHEGDGSDLMFHHGIPVKAGLESLAGHIFKEPIKTKRDEIGIWAETILDQSDKYEQKVAELVDKGKLKWSSGSTGRLVRRENDGKITRWPIIEGSLTHTPAYPINAVTAVKSMSSWQLEGEAEPEVKLPTSALAAKLQQHIDDLIDDGVTREDLVGKMAREAGVTTKIVEAMISGENSKPSNANIKAFARVLEVEVDVLKAVVRKDYAQSVKGMFEEALAERAPSRWELETVYCNILGKLASAASTSKVAGVSFNLEQKVTEATSEYASRLLTSAIKQINEYVDGSQSESDYHYEPFYFKAAITEEDGLKGLDSLDLDQHSSLVVSANRGISARFRGNHGARVKIGRSLSERNRLRLTELKTQLQITVDEMQKLIDESMPQATEAEKAAAQIELLRIKYNTIKLGAENYV